MSKSIIKYVGCSSTGALITYVADDGTWDGSDEDADRLPTVEVGRDFGANKEDMTHEEIVTEFKKRGIDAVWPEERRQ